MPGVALYLIRHGIAEAQGEAWPDDAKRPLTDDGIARLRKIARGLARLDVSIDVMLTSPLIRARQTAELIATGLDPRPHVTTIDSLAPGGTFAAVLADLEKQAKRSGVALVGHEPGIGELAARLAGFETCVFVQEGRRLPDRTSKRCRRPARARCGGFCRPESYGRFVSAEARACRRSAAQVVALPVLDLLFDRFLRLILSAEYLRIRFGSSAVAGEP